MIRVATFNILHGRPWPGRWPFMPGPFRSSIAGLDVDILGLQEVDRHVYRTWFTDQSKLAAEALCASTARNGSADRWPGGAPRSGHEVSAGRSPEPRARECDQIFAGAQWLGPGGRMGNALCVRGTVTDVETVWHPTALGHEHRNTIVASATVRDTTLSIGVTHLQNYRDEAHAGLATTIAALAERPEPRVLLGDLNLPTDECRTAIEAAGYTLLDTDGPDGRVITHDGAPRIDHIATMGIAGVEVAVPKPPISDHAPIVVELG